MADDLISADVREFISECIDSVAQLEALLLLRNHPDQSWNVASVASRLYVSEADAADALNALDARGLLSCAGDVYRFNPKNGDRRGSVDGVAKAYAQYLVPVTNLIHDKSLRIRMFADAFKFRKDK